jgi:hypothetical protein
MKREQPEAAIHFKYQRWAYLKVGGQSAQEWLSGSRATSCTGPFSSDRKTGRFAHVARAAHLWIVKKSGSRDWFMLNMITLSSSEKGMKIRAVLVQLGQQIVVVPTPHELILQLFKLCDAITFEPKLIFPIWKRTYQTILSCEHRECRDFWIIRHAAPADPPWKKLTIFERNCNMSEGGLGCPHLWETGMHCEHEKLDLYKI